MSYGNYNSYKILYKGNHQEFIDLLLKGVPNTCYDITKDPIDKDTVHGTIRQLAERRWPVSSIVWRRLIGPHKHAVMQIETTVGKFSLMRNGSNVSHYNFAILNHSEPTDFIFAQNVTEALDIVEILSTPRNDLPLLISKYSKARTLNLLEQRLKSST